MIRNVFIYNELVPLHCKVDKIFLFELYLFQKVFFCCCWNNHTTSPRETGNDSKLCPPEMLILHVPDKQAMIKNCVLLKRSYYMNQVVSSWKWQCFRIVVEWNCVFLTNFPVLRGPKLIEYEKFPDHGWVLLSFNLHTLLFYLHSTGLQGLVRVRS